MNPFKKEAPFVVDVYKHAGRYRGVHGGIMSCWEVRNVMIEPFGDITKAVSTELGSCRFPRSTFVIFDLFLRGSSPNSAEIYVMLAGATEQHRKKAVKRLRKSSLTKNYPGLKIDHWEWPPDAPQVVMMGADDDSLLWTTVHRSQGYEIRFSGRAPEGSPLEKLGNISYHIVATDGESPTDDADDPGAPQPNTIYEGSFGANSGVSKKKSGVLSHYVTTGGKQYLLAPAHIFLDDEPDDTDDFSDTNDSDSDLNSNSDAESSFDVRLRAGSATPPDLEPRSAADSATPPGPESRTADNGATAPDLKSRPAADSSIDESSSDRTSDRTSVFDSCTRRKGKHAWPEISSIQLDYALIPASTTQESDILAGLSRLVEETTASLPFEKDGSLFSSTTVERSVSVATPSHGLLTGQISTRPMMMRLPYSETFSMLYPLELSYPVEPGDCGSVVFDRLSRVYGFIAAGSTTGNVAYVVPASDILKDIRSRLGGVPEGVLVGFEPSTTKLPPTATQARMIQEEPSERLKISSWPLVISDLPFNADEGFVRNIAPGIDGLDGIVMHLSAYKATSTCRDATLSFASEAAALLAYGRLRSQRPHPYTVVPLFNISLLDGDQSPQNLKGKQPELTLNDTHIPVTPIPGHAQDAIDTGHLQETIGRLAAEIEVLRANNAKLYKDLSVREAEAAVKKEKLETQATIIRTFEQKYLAPEAAPQDLTRLAQLEREEAKHGRNDHTSLISLPATANNVLSSLWRTVSTTSVTTPESETDWEPPVVSHSGGRDIIQHSDRATSSRDASIISNAQLEAANNDLVHENGRLKVNLKELQDKNQELIKRNANLTFDLNRFRLSEKNLSRSNLRRDSGFFSGTTASSSGSSRNSRRSGTSSRGSKRSVTTASSSIIGSIWSKATSAVRDDNQFFKVSEDTE